MSYMRIAIFVACICIGPAGSAEKWSQPHQRNQDIFNWVQIRHFVNNEEIPGAPMADLGEKGWLLVMPNFWTGSVIIPKSSKVEINDAMTRLSEINWSSRPIPIILPNMEGDGYASKEKPPIAPTSKRGLVPGGEIIYANGQAWFLPN